MNSFSFHNPTQIFFGENSISNLKNALKPYGKNILLAYGGGSIKKSGIYDNVIEILKSADKEIFEISGIMPNPRTEKVYEGAKICKENNIDFILAVGGGSVIDCAKAIAAAAKTDEDFWQKFLIRKEPCDSALPLGSILTLAGTGSEMNRAFVISHWEENKKIGYGDSWLYPKFSILDPTYTYTLPKDQLVNGTVDIFSHIFELYFSQPNESNLSDDIAEAIMKNIIKNLAVALKDPSDYRARANLMWDSTMALNGITGAGKSGDWQSHQIEHALSAFHDIPHGAGLAIVHPNFMKYTYKEGIEKYVQYAVNVWNIDTSGKTDDAVALEGIQRTKDYFSEIGAPVTLTEVGIPKEDIDKMVKNVGITGGGYKNLTSEDIKNILIQAL